MKFVNISPTQIKGDLQYLVPKIILFILNLQWKHDLCSNFKYVLHTNFNKWFIYTPVLSGEWHMRRQVTGDTTPFRRPVITNFRAAARPFSTEGWSGFTTGSWPIISDSEILGGGTSDTTGNFNFVSESVPCSESICNLGYTCI